MITKKQAKKLKKLINAHTLNAIDASLPGSTHHTVSATQESCKELKRYIKLLREEVINTEDEGDIFS